jgi:Fe-S cluster assembly iron-binding protein IscA
MVVVTQKAKQHIKEMLAAKTSNPNVGMRLVLKSGTGKFALRFDKEREHDQVVSYNDSKVLLIDKIIAAHKGMLTIDFGGVGAFPRLVIVKR